MLARNSNEGVHINHLPIQMNGHYRFERFAGSMAERQTTTLIACRSAEIFQHCARTHVARASVDVDELWLGAGLSNGLHGRDECVGHSEYGVTCADSTRHQCEAQCVSAT